MQKVQFGALGYKSAAITRNDTMQECFVPANGLMRSVVEMIFGAKCQTMPPEDYSGMLRCIVKNSRGREVGTVILFERENDATSSQKSETAPQNFDNVKSST